MNEKLRLYGQLMRADRPIGTWLVFWPACWGLLLGGQGYVPVATLALFLLGSFLTRSAGCVLNDLADHKLDAKVERTKTRPLAAGLVSKKEALALAVLLLAAAGILLFFLPIACLWIALLAVPMMVAYPFMKRITYWPQLFLGITFNLGCLIGVVAMGGDLNAAAWLLYSAAVLWTLGYDSIYAYQDVKYDVRVGIKSTIIGWGERSDVIIACCFVLMVTALSAVAWLEQWPLLSGVMLVMLAIGMGWMWYARSWQQNSDAALQDFKRQHWVGAWIAWAIFLAAL